MANYRVAANACVRKVVDDVFILNRDTGNINLLSETGHAIWEMLKAEVSIEGMVSRLLQEYEVDRPTTERDVREFLDKLVQKGLAVGV